MPDRHRFALENPWTVEASNFPRNGEPTDKLMFLVNYAVLAPSILNTQPWRFRVSDRAVTMFADSARKLPITDPHGRELLISCGAALLNLRMAMRSYGYACDIRVHPEAESLDPLVQAMITGRENPSGLDRRLRDAIVARRTNRNEFEARALPPELLSDLSAAAKRESATLICMTEPEAKRRVVDLVGEAERTFLADLRYRDELGRWIQQRVTESTSWTPPALESPARNRPEHKPQPDLATLSAANMGRTFPPGPEAFARHKGHLATAPVLALIATDDDTAAGWLAAGQAMQLVLLVATNAGVSASFLNPPIELPTFRTKLADLFETTAMPQVLLRLGYGPKIAPTPRRAVNAVVD